MPTTCTAPLLSSLLLHTVQNWFSLMHPPHTSSHMLDSVKVGRWKHNFCLVGGLYVWFSENFSFCTSLAFYGCFFIASKFPFSLKISFTCLSISLYYNVLSWHAICPSILLHFDYHMCIIYSIVLAKLFHYVEVWTFCLVFETGPLLYYILPALLVLTVSMNCRLCLSSQFFVMVHCLLDLYMYVWNTLFSLKFLSCVYLPVEFQSNVGCFNDGLPNLGAIFTVLFLRLELSSDPATAFASTAAFIASITACASACVISCVSAIICCFVCFFHLFLSCLSSWDLVNFKSAFVILS